MRVPGATPIAPCRLHESRRPLRLRPAGIATRRLTAGGPELCLSRAMTRTWSQSKYPTGTLAASNELVPWLAATGPLAYTPEHPPSRDYYFQYGWILPQVLNAAGDRKRHRFFGRGAKGDAEEIFAFWNNARAGNRTRVHMEHGSVSPLGVTAPLAVYLHEDRVWKRTGYMLIQHGSYQHVGRDDQPELADGFVHLYRGVQEAKVFRYFHFDVGALPTSQRAAWKAYLTTQAEVLSDSAVSFNSIHDRTSRCETGGLNDRSFVTDEIATRNGLSISDGGFSAQLWLAHHQCFSLQRRLAEWKFGPNYVVCKTPLTNIRITTFFAGEAEAKIIDPNKVERVETVGCEWRFGCR